MITEFHTISARSESTYKEKGSKFIGITLPVSSIEEVKNRLGEIRQQYHDARHHCYAYVLGKDKSEFRANDDGEPNHSAGDPILGQIRANGLTNVLVIVVRYFGGTKLGVSGLINAYRTAAEGAIENGEVRLVKVTKMVSLRYDYTDTSHVMRLVAEFDLKITDQKFESSCEMIGDLVVDRVKALEQKIQLLHEMGITIKLTID